SNGGGCAAPPSLTLRHGGALTPALLEKTFFSTRRPALETGGQRPTARCALGRESVWTIVLAWSAETYLGRHHPPCAQLRTGAGDPVSQRPLGWNREAAAYWIPRFRGV